MACMSNFLKNKLIDFVFRGVTYSPPASLYIALFTAAPTDAGGGTEVTGGSYARVAVTSNTTNWASTGGAGTTTNPSAGTSGTTSNNGSVAFPTASASWGTVIWGGIFDASTGGNMLFAGALFSSQSIPSGVTFTLPAGQIQYLIDGAF